jgi:mannose-6-phosphate isomerase-like protein (cupin superfamily)
MSTATRFLRRDPAEARPWAETCGQIRCLIEAKDGAAGEVHHVEIRDAKLHYHEHTDEFYYIISGKGTMTWTARRSNSTQGWSCTSLAASGTRHGAT